MNTDFNPEIALPAVDLPHRTSVRLARLVSNVFSPPVISLAGAVVIAKASGTTACYKWMILYLLVAMGIPVAYVAYKVRHGDITDFYMVVRRQRIRPMLMILACSTVGWLILWLGHAPGLLVTIAGVIVPYVILLLMLTLKWKVSGHAATITALALLTSAFFGRVAYPLFLAVPLVCWARVRIKRHSLPQTLGGVMLGISFVLVTLWVNRL